MARGHELRIPAAASDDEAAAIAVAVEQWLAEEARTGADGSTDDPWRGRRFAFAGRLEKVVGEPVRVPKGAPADPWAAAGRLSRE